MAFDFTWVDTAVPCASAAGEAIVLVALSRQNSWRKLPMFTLYVLWGMISDLANLYIQKSVSTSFYEKYFNFEVVTDAALQFTVLVELAWSVLKPIRKSLPRATLPVLIVLIAGAGLIIWPIAAKMPPPTDLKPDGLLLFHLDETFAILRVVCFILMASLSQVLSIGWKDRELQVATGLGFYAIVKILVILFHSHQQAKEDLYHWLDISVSVSYLCTLAYWVFSFVTKEQERKEFSPQMQHLLLQLGGGARAGRIALTGLPSERPRKKD